MYIATTHTPLNSKALKSHFHHFRKMDHLIIQVDLSEFETMVVLLDEVNYIYGNLTFLNQTIIDADVNLAQDHISNVNITLLAEEAVTQSTTQTITGML